MRTGKLHRFTRIAALILGVAVLGFSIYWSQDGFNFDLAGDSGYGQLATIAGWVLAVTVTVLELLFSTNLRDLNPTLFVLGMGAYVYSIYTNYGGILHFQGHNPNNYGAIFLAICVDAAPEPMIAWALGESLTGDVLGNILGGVKNFFSSLLDDGPKHQNQNQQNREPAFRSEQNHTVFPVQNQKKGHDKKYTPSHRPAFGPSDTKPNRFDGFGE